MAERPETIFNSAVATRRVVIVGGAALLVAFFGMRQAIRASRVAGFENQLRDHFKQIELGLHNYSSTFDFLPPATIDAPDGAPLSSWRFKIWTIIENSQIQKDLKVAWDAPINRRARRFRLECFCWDEATPNRDTHVFAIAGPGTAFAPKDRVRMSELPPQLAVVMEIADSKTHWMQPGDYNVTELLAYAGRIGDHLHGLLPDRLHVLFADGEVWALSPDAPMTALHPFLTIAGAKAHDRNKLLAPHRVR